MNNIAELEKEIATAKAKLAQAEKDAAATRLAMRWQELKETVENRVFFDVSAGTQRKKNPKIECIGLCLYTNIQQDSWNPNGFIADIESLVFNSKAGIWKNSGISHEIQKKTRMGESLDRGKEVSKAIFDELKAISLNKSEIIFETAKTLIQADAAINLDYLKTPSIEVELDAPHIALEPFESTILGESIFMLEGYRFLLTPNSIKWAKAQIEEERVNLGRGAQFYQECDWDYVNRQRESMNRILAKLNGAS